MISVDIVGWDDGFNKIQFNVFLRENCNYSLAEAFDVVNKVLANEPVQITFCIFTNTHQKRLVELGVKFKALSEESS